MSNDEMSEYRKSLIALEQRMQFEFDKAIMALSGGALGLTFIYLRDVVRSPSLEMGVLLFSAWLSWGISIACVIGSFLTSTHAMKRAVRQFDDGTIHEIGRGGLFNRATPLLNLSAGVFFLSGVTFIACFIWRNIP